MINMSIGTTIFGGLLGFLDVSIEDIMRTILLDEIGATTIVIYKRYLFFS